MAFLYPWGNTQQLNLDWILQKIKELEASGGSGGGGVDLDEVANALISATYSRRAYDRSDIVYRDGKLYRANQAIPAPGEAWTPAHWDEILLGDTVSNLVQYVAALSNDQIANSSNVSGTHTSDALNTLKSQIEGVTVDSDSVNNESQVAGATVSDALDTLNSAIKYLFISSPSQVGLTGTPTLAALVNAMPYYSLAYINTTELDLTALNNYADVNVVHVIKLTPGRIFAIGARSNLNVTDAQSKIYFATYSHNDLTWHGFFELARLTSVTDEETARINADNALGGLISDETTARINAINALKKNNLTNITNFTTGDYPESNPFVAPSDGYIFLSNASGETARFLIYGAEQNTAYLQLGYTEGRFSMFVRAGLKIALNGTASTARFVALS